MVTVEYRINGNVGEWQSLNGRGRIIEFNLGDNGCGTLFFGGRNVSLENGRCRVSTDGLSFGEYTPRVDGDDGVIILEPLIVIGERVSPAPTAESIHRTTLHRLYEAEKKIKILEERTNELSDLIKGTALFE